MWYYTLTKYLAEWLQSRIPFPTPKQYHVGNGTLLQESHFDKDGTLIKTKKWEYSFKGIEGESPQYILEAV
jgi:hypothetical protein